ncbi:MAG: OmpA family protein [Fibrobacter sp.]|nr:OmpA family protein [Fibrobacter sp.]
MTVFRFCSMLIAVLSGYTIASDYPVINNSGHVGLVQLYSAKSLGSSRLLFSTSADFGYDKNFVTKVISPKELYGLDTSEPEIAMSSLRPSFAFGITNFLDVSLTLPIYLDLMNHYLPQGGIGDLNLGLKFRVPGDKPRLVQGGVLTALRFPTGTPRNGYFPRNTYYFRKDTTNSSANQLAASCYSSRSVETEFLGLFTLDLKWFQFHINSGVNITYNKDLDDVFLFSSGFELRPSNHFAFFTEMSTETRFQNVSDGFKIAEDPFRITPGISLTSSGGANFSLSGSFKLSSNRNDAFYYTANDNKTFTSRIEPAWKVQIQLGWNGLLVAQDRDRDLIRDVDDACPDDAEDADNFEDGDGCPDLDNDHDAIPDSLDKCPNDAEDLDGYEDDDGCPDYDNDFDGIPDSTDRCIDTKEDKDGFADRDGCPDYDNDSDGIPDSLDKCPVLAEDLDRFEDEDGCPDIDNDLDGVPDSIDACPDSAGTSENGCPKAKPKAKEIKRGRVILQGVSFEGGSAILSSSSQNALEQVFESLSDYSEVRLEIQAHTDNSGAPAASRALSQKRAETVRDYLVSKGIDANRLSVSGRGDSEPIADNSTIHGRKLNNRIEIHRRD